MGRQSYCDADRREAFNSLWISMIGTARMEDEAEEQIRKQARHATGSRGRSPARTVAEVKEMQGFATPKYRERK
jgi:hypothetical protein